MDRRLSYAKPRIPGSMGYFALAREVFGYQHSRLSSMEVDGQTQNYLIGFIYLFYWSLEDRQIMSMHRYFSEVSILPLEILLPYIWEIGTYIFSLVNCWSREGSWVMDEAFRDQKGGHKSELNSPECWPETRILPPCQIGSRRKAILIKCYSLSPSSKLDGSVLLTIADFLEIWVSFSRPEMWTEACL